MWFRPLAPGEKPLPVTVYTDVRSGTLLSIGDVASLGLPLRVAVAVLDAMDAGNKVRVQDGRHGITITGKISDKTYQTCMAVGMLRVLDGGLYYKL